jgi:hypothetical protein
MKLEEAQEDNQMLTAEAAGRAVNEQPMMTRRISRTRISNMFCRGTVLLEVAYALLWRC